MNPTLTVPMTLEAPRFTGESTVGEVLAALNHAVQRAYGNKEEFVRDWKLDPNARWYKTRQHWMVIFFAEGNSDGHYVHVNTLPSYENPYDDDGKRTSGIIQHLFMLKTFHGYDRAQEIVRIAQFVLTNGKGS